MPTIAIPGQTAVEAGATTSGLRRPSSVGPWEEYEAAASPSQSRAPTVNDPRASPGVGMLEPTVASSPSSMPPPKISRLQSTPGVPCRMRRP